MVQAISTATPTQAVAPPTKTATAKAQPQPQAATSTDSVKLSQAGQAALANLQEIRETNFQTAQEAGKGDSQARRLLSKEAAANPVHK